MELLYMTLYVLGTLATAVVLHWAIQVVQLLMMRSRDGEALKQFGGPPGHWLFGNVLETLSFEDRCLHAIGVARDFPKVCKTRISPFHYMLDVHHPDTVKTILSTAEPKFDLVTKFLKPWIGDSLVVSKGQKWARHRRLLTPAFHFDILKDYVPIFSESSLIMVDKLKRAAAGEKSVELFETTALMTFDCMMKCIFGFFENYQQEGFKHPYLQGVYEISRLLTQRFFCFPHYSDFIYYLSWSGYKFRRACASVHDYSREIIKKKRQEIANNKTYVPKRMFFMDLLLRARDEDGRGLTDEEIQAEVDTFMLAGQDTTASGISWCLHNLARNPEYQAKCRQEANSVLGDRQQFTWDDMKNLPFLTMCIKESLRLHSPVPNISRETENPLKFPDGREIASGIKVAIGILTTHYDPEVWPDPGKFDPYRFTLENSKDRSPYAFIPFSAGPRNCIGQNFALHEMRVAVGQIIRHLELSVDEDKLPIRDPLAILKAKNGIFVKIAEIPQ